MSAASQASVVSVRETVIANLALVVTVACWGAFFPALELLLESWDFYSATIGRQIVGSAALLTVVAAQRRSSPIPAALPWGRILLMGFVGVALCSLLTTLGVRWSTGLSAAIISTTNPISAALTAALLFGISPARGIVIGTLLSVVGGVVAVLGEAGPGGLAELRGGEILIVVANFAWTWMSVAAQRWLKGCSQVQITAFTIAAGAIWLLLMMPLFVAAGFVSPHVELAPVPLLLLAFAALGPIAVGNVCWHYGVSRLGVVVASMYNNLLPLSAALATLWLGHAITALQMVGAGIILVGVVTAQLLALRPR